jgi:hypothetical protein
MTEDLRIYIVTKNAVRFPEETLFQPIQGGAALTSVKIPRAIGDDSGDSISLENEYYAEISSMYWVWKNAPRSDYVGFFHYRRFLNFGEPLCPEEHWSKRNFFDFEPSTLQRFGWTKDLAQAALGGCDLAIPHREPVIRPPQWDQPCSIYTHYRNSHVTRDINLALQVIKELYPNDYHFAKNVIESYYGHFCHMYVMRWQMFQEYMSWLIPILQGVGRRIDVNSPIYAMGSGQTRMLGFLGERLFNVYIERCRLDRKTIREFERLFGIFPEDWSISLSKTDPPEALRIARFQKGVSVHALGWQVDLFAPD